MVGEWVDPPGGRVVHDWVGGSSPLIINGKIFNIVSSYLGDFIFVRVKSRSKVFFGKQP